MPAGFDNCVKSGGRVRTKKLSGDSYMHICFKGGKSYAGEVHHKKKKHSNGGGGGGGTHKRHAANRTRKGHRRVPTKSYNSLG